MTAAMAPAGPLAFPAVWRATLVAISGLYGGAGVMLAAVAAHLKGGAGLATAADFLMVHATLVVAIAALAGQVFSPRAWLTLGTMVVVGVTFFSGDVALSALASRRLFPMAAPVGGVLLIGCWLGMSILAVTELARAMRA